MSQNFLIDGYNLLHALGLPSGKLGPHGLEKARGRLIGLIATSLRGQNASATLIFDAPRRKPKSEAEQFIEGLQILFAVNYQDADEMIEELIRKDAHPRQLAVVSDDHRVQKAAQRRRCEVVSCAVFLEMLEESRTRKTHQTSKEAEKTTNMTGEEKQRWVEEFADLNNDPAMKELFNPFDFEEEEN